MSLANRKVPDWIEGYMQFVEKTESAKVFHKWVAISMIAAVLRKKVRLSLGRLNVYPNMYIVLVAEPGVARKSQAINYGTKFLDKIPEIFTTADSITREALLQDLEASAIDEQMPDGKAFRHASISIISKEFEAFLGQKAENTKMLVLLTDLFDAQEVPWRYRTKSSGNSTVPNVYINLLGATTPESLASSLPPSAIGGGLTSRILFIYAARGSGKFPKPIITPEMQEMAEKLQSDLFRISKLAGVYEFSPEADQYWHDWYMAYEPVDNRRICKDKSFDGWYSRKQLFIQKLAQIRTASTGDSMEITLDTLKLAISDVEEVEVCMSRTFRAIGRSDVTQDVDVVMQIINDHQAIREKDLMSIIWRDIDAAKFDNVINTALKTGKVKRVFEHKQVKGIWYLWEGVTHGES